MNHTISDAQKYSGTYLSIYALYMFLFFDIKVLVLLRGLERTHTFLVPIINPPFAENSPHSFSIQQSRAFRELGFVLRDYFSR